MKFAHEYGIACLDPFNRALPPHHSAEDRIDALQVRLWAVRNKKLARARVPTG